MKPELYLGLMSGTSVDSVDVALVEFENNTPKLHDFYSHDIPIALKSKLLKCNQTQQLSLQDFCELQNATGRLFADSVQAFLQQQKLPAGEITAIGSHGQTIFHAPNVGMSLQIGHPAMIAKQTGIQTVADFRIDDMALGGQGAPFAPAFHQYLFSEEKPVVAVNIGGISNISLLPAHASQTPLLGFDTGPGNGLMDEVCQKHLNQAFDRNGEIAASGNPHPILLKQLLTDPYFAKPAPKSTGRDKFNWAWLNQHLSEQIAPNDLLATLCELTAITIAQAIKAQINTNNLTVWICGGGAFNAHLIQRIQAQLPDAKVQNTLATGINPNAIEAMLFAWLAKMRLENRPVNLKDVTGASRNAILGAVWQA